MLAIPSVIAFTYSLKASAFALSLDGRSLLTLITHDDSSWLAWRGQTASLYTSTEASMPLS